MGKWRNVRRGAKNVEMGVRTFDPELAWAGGFFEGHYEARDGFKRKPYWVWLAMEYEALEVLELLWPWLSHRRRGQAMDHAPLEAIHLEASKEDSVE